MNHLECERHIEFRHTKPLWGAANGCALSNQFAYIDSGAVPTEANYCYYIYQRREDFVLLP